MKGDLVEATYERGKIVLKPRPVLDLSEFPDAANEYTPAQRRAIDARLAKADADIRRGRVYGPFATAEAMAVSIEANIKKARAAKGKRKPAR